MAVGHLQRQYRACGTKCKLLVELGSGYDTVRHLCHWAFRIFPSLQVCLWQELLYSKYAPNLCSLWWVLLFLLFCILFCLFQSRFFYTASCLNHPNTRIIGTHHSPHGLGVAFENKCRNWRFKSEGLGIGQNQGHGELN